MENKFRRLQEKLDSLVKDTKVDAKAAKDTIRNIQKHLTVIQGKYAVSADAKAELAKFEKIMDSFIKTNANLRTRLQKQSDEVHKVTRRLGK